MSPRSVQDPIPLDSFDLAILDILQKDNSIPQRTIGEMVNLSAPAVQRRNRIALDWSGAWRLDTGGSDHLDREAIDIAVRFTARIPIRPVRLIAEGCALRRAEVETLITEGRLVSTARLNTRVSDDFTFTLKR